MRWLLESSWSTEKGRIHVAQRADATGHGGEGAGWRRSAGGGAVDAERETDELKKTEFMLDKIGEEFDGIISSVTNFGLFVELPNTIEGLVHVSYLTDDYYHYDERQYAMIGERTGNVFRIGDEITVRVINVNKDERSIDFEVVGMKSTRRSERKEAPKIVVANPNKKPRNGSKNGDSRSDKKPKKKKKFYENAPSAKRKKKKTR